MNCHFIIAAAGSGTRFGAPLPKQYCLMAGRPVLMHTVDALRRAVPRATMALVLAKGDLDLWTDLCAKYGFDSPDVVVGGPTRYASIRNAMELMPAGTDVVLVHDGARPLPSPALIADVINAVEQGAQGAIPSLAVTDSMRLLAADGRSEAVDRSRYRTVQTPQGFRADLLADAYRKGGAEASFTDDASLMEHFGYCDLRLTEGHPYNIKITRPGDIELAEFFLSLI